MGLKQIILSSHVVITHWILSAVQPMPGYCPAELYDIYCLPGFSVLNLCQATQPKPFFFQLILMILDMDLSSRFEPQQSFWWWCFHNAAGFCTQLQSGACNISPNQDDAPSGRKAIGGRVPMYVPLPILFICSSCSYSLLIMQLRHRLGHCKRTNH